MVEVGDHKIQTDEEDHMGEEDFALDDIGIPNIENAMDGQKFMSSLTQNKNHWLQSLSDGPWQQKKLSFDSFLIVSA